MNKDTLTKSTVSIGIQILCLKPASVMLADGREGNWMWGHGNDATLVIPGRHIQQISPDLITEGNEASLDAVTYGFQSNQLQDLAGIMFGGLDPEDIHGLIETQCTENFPYRVEGMYLCVSHDMEMFL